MGIPSEARDCPITRQDDVTKEDKTENDLQTANFDSGYHSFTSAPTRCHQSNSEMITTSLGHEDDFPPPSIPSGYDTRFSRGRHLGSSPVTLSEDKSHLVYNELYTSRTISSSLPPSPPTVEIRDTNSSNCDGTLELTEKIQFFLKLGYCEKQIRSGLYSVGPHASKNDILMAIAEVSNDVGTYSKTYTEDGAVDEKAGRSHDVELVPRGPSSTAEDDPDVADNLRPIVIDGSNVAMSHGNKEYFSCKGIQIAVQYFLDRGHRDITVFVPIYRREQTRPDAPIKDQEILRKLEADKILVWTPSRHVSGRRITCYDDRFIVKLAEMTKGVIVSNDNFRDLQNEKPEWKELIEKRLLMYSFVSDRFMPPDDPLGRNGPSLDNFLRIRSESEEKKKPECPYGKKCTYGKKCKYFHPEVPLTSVSERTRRRATPVGVAQEMAEEVINSAVCNGRNGTTHKNGKVDVAKKTEESAPGTSQPQGQRAISPSAMGAFGGSKHLPPTTNANHTPVSSIAGITNDLSNISVNPHNGYPPKYSYPTPHGDNNSHSAGANVPTTTPRMGHHLLTPPAFHSQMVDGVGRNGAASATNPQRVHSHISPPMNHSSPSVMPSYDRSLLDQHPSMGPHQFPMTYPSQHHPPHPSYQYYPYRDMMIYHHHMYQHLARMSGMPSQGNPPAPSQHPYPPYAYPPQHPMMPPTTNLTSPHPGVRQPVYSPGHHSSPPQFQHGSQHRSAPMDQAPQPGFRDTSNPRHYLFKNLCGLFNPRTVENVLLANPRENDPKKLAKLCLDMD